MDRCISCLLKCTPNECLVILRNVRRKRWRMKEKLEKLVAEIHAQIKRIKAGDNWESRGRIHHVLSTGSEAILISRIVFIK